MADLWKDLVASASAAASATLPIVLALAPLCLGSIVVFGTPPLLEEAAKFLKSVGWLK